MTTLKITINNDLASTSPAELGSYDDSSEHNQLQQKLRGKQEALVGSILKKANEIQSMLDDLCQGESAPTDHSRDGGLKPQPNVQRLGTGELTSDQLVHIFGPNGAGRAFDKYVNMTDPNTGVVTRHKIKDWASLPGDMFLCNDDYYNDYDNCRTEADIAYYFDQKKNENVGPEVYARH